ncbi:MAG: hypothetical protein ACOZB3_11010 [Calditrichota bacterium]
MAKILLLIGGLLNALLTIFHVLFWKLFDWPAKLMYMTPDDRALMQVFNIHGVLTIGLFTYVSLFHRRELLTTGLGRVMCIAIAVYYYVRALNSLIFWDVTIPEEAVIFVICLGIGVIYTLPALNRFRKPN